MIVPPLSEEAVSMLLLLGMHAYHDPQLLTQLARIVRHITLANTVLFASPDTMGEAYQRSVMVRSPAPALWLTVGHNVCSWYLHVTHAGCTAVSHDGLVMLSVDCRWSSCWWTACCQPCAWCLPSQHWQMKCGGRSTF